MIVVLFWLIGSIVCQASDWGEVEAIWIPDVSGNWQRVDQTGAAVRVESTSGTTDGAVRGEVADGTADTVEIPVYVGMALQPGHRIRTTQARVRLRLGRFEQMIVRVDSDIELIENGTIQRIGEALYDVRGRFRVQYRGVEAAVEGTRFVVGDIQTDGQQGPGVSVLSGRVRVSSVGQSVVVNPGQQVAASAAAPPATPVKMSDAVRIRNANIVRTLGLPGASAAVLWTGGMSSTALTGLRIQGRLRLLRGWRAVSQVEWVTNGAQYYFPYGLGMEHQLGPVGIGGMLDTHVGQLVDCDGNSQLSMRVGGSVSARLRIGLSERFGFESQLKVGFVEAPMVDVALGVSFGG